MKLLILDRDGVINKDSKNFIKSIDEWQPIAGSLEAIGRLSQAGYNIVIITNQSGIGRELLSVDMLGQIHIRMIDQIESFGGKIHSILFCPHHPDDQCQCRKPKTGLYQELINRLNVNLSEVYSVGDSLRDLLAAFDAGAKPVLVKTGNGKRTQKNIQQNSYPELNNLPVYSNLSAFADALLNTDLLSKNI